MDVSIYNNLFLCYYYITKTNGCKAEREHMYKKKLGQTYYTNRHSCFLLQYHIVLVTKYRCPVLTGAVKELVYQVIQDIFDEKDLVILEMNGEADHIHILFEADPFTAPGTLVNVIKTKTSRYARKQYGDTFMKESCQDSLFWSNSYFTTIANENSLQLIQEYINNQ